MKLFSHKRLALVLISSTLLSACNQESHWERTLIGPFQGEPYDGQLSSPAVSSLVLSPNLDLDVHWGSMSNDPIICLRGAGGTSIWARVLIPRLDGQREPSGRITQLTLN